MQRVNWIYKGREITSIPQQFEDYEGFTYRITLSDGTYYLGKKNLTLSKKRKIGAKELAERGKSAFRKYKSKKGENKGKWIYYEDKRTEEWQQYYGSSDEVKEIVESGADYSKEILSFYKTKGELTYREHKLIICSDCMEDERCLNKRVGNFHKRNVIRYIAKGSSSTDKIN